MFQPKPISLNTRWDLDSGTNSFTPCQNNTRSLENVVKSFFHQTTPEFNIDCFYTKSRQKELAGFTVDGFVLIATLRSKQWADFTTFVPVKEYVHPFPKKISNATVRKESLKHRSETIYKKR